MDAPVLECNGVWSLVAVLLFAAVQEGNNALNVGVKELPARTCACIMDLKTNHIILCMPSAVDHSNVSLNSEHEYPPLALLIFFDWIHNTIKGFIQLRHIGMNTLLMLFFTVLCNVKTKTFLCVVFIVTKVTFIYICVGRNGITVLYSNIHCPD